MFSTKWQLAQHCIMFSATVNIFRRLSVCSGVMPTQSVRINSHQSVSYGHWEL